MLRVVAWDDPRCTEPLKAARQPWLDRSGETIDIARRPLTAFNDQPLSELSGQCDVMIIDYPHIPQAWAEGAVTPIADLLDPAIVTRCRAGAVGAAQDSFVVNGTPVALAADAACQVAAYRPAILDDLGATVPDTWDAVVDLAARHPGSVALPLHHTDAISCILSLTAGAGTPPNGGDRLFPHRAVTEEAIDTLKRVAAIVDDVCWSCTPPMLYAEANKGQDIGYIPLTFGYTRLTRQEEGGGWRFGAPPAGCGSLLGGAGMAVSSQASDPAQAAAFVAWYCGEEGQVFAALNGGQPASRAAWTSAEADEAVGHFFSDTIEVQSRAYVRPRAPWWPGVQTAAGQRLVQGLRSGESSSSIVDGLEHIYADRRPPGEKGA